MNRTGDAQTFRSALTVAARLPIGQSAYVLEMLASCPKTTELLVSNPALAVCLAWVLVGCGSTGTQFDPAACLRSKRRVLCGMLGFPPFESTVRVLAKVRPEAAAAWQLKQLREPISNSHLRKLLSHVPTIHARHLLVAIHLKSSHAVSPHLFQEIADDRPEWNARRHCTLADDTVWLLGYTGRKARTFDSIAQLGRTYEKLVQETGLDGPAGVGAMAIPFPAPPFPGTADIVPITSPEALRAEGRVVKHCVARYAVDVLMGHRFIYRMVRPERVTIGLRKKSGGEWGIFDVRTYANKRPRDETLDAVVEWLQKSRVRCPQNSET